MATNATSNEDQLRTARRMLLDAQQRTKETGVRIERLRALLNTKQERG